MIRLTRPFWRQPNASPESRDPSKFCNVHASDGGEPGDRPEAEPGSPGIAVEEGRPELKQPRKYAVLLHNDDYTTMEFVVEVLQRFFRKSHDEAMDITMKVHHEGRGLAGMFSLQIAETKVAQVSELAKSRNFPLKCTMEPV